MKLHVATSLAEVDPLAWNRLAGDDPFLQHAFLHALHDAGCGSPDTGWTPQYLLLHDDGALTGAMPLYLKTHSYGEYVFDWAWADAYQRHGLAYYPKLLSAMTVFDTATEAVKQGGTEGEQTWASSGSTTPTS